MRTLIIALCLVVGPFAAAAADAPSWAQKDVRLATEYLNILVDKPEFGRVVDLLWDLYDKHGSTSFLLESIAAQAKQQPHPNVLLVQAHLLRKAGKLQDARRVYEAALSKDRTNPIALRA